LYSANNSYRSLESILHAIDIIAKSAIAARRTGRTLFELLELLTPRLLRGSKRTQRVLDRLGTLLGHLLDLECNALESLDLRAEVIDLELFGCESYGTRILCISRSLDEHIILSRDLDAIVKHTCRTTLGATGISCLSQKLGKLLL